MQLGGKSCQPPEDTHWAHDEIGGFCLMDVDEHRSMRHLQPKAKALRSSAASRRKIHNALQSRNQSQWHTLSALVSIKEFFKKKFVKWMKEDKRLTHRAGRANCRFGRAGRRGWRRIAPWRRPCSDGSRISANQRLWEREIWIINESLF